MSTSLSLNYTYNQIIGFFEQAANEHLAINSFGTGPLHYLDSKSQNIIYPYLFVRPMSSPGLVDNTRTLNFEIYSLDIPSLSDDSPVDVMSNTEIYLYDIGAWFNFGPNQQNIEYVMGNITPVNEAFNDRAFGWAASVDIIVPFVYNYCHYPKI
jgi:hypothetical protein